MRFDLTDEQRMVRETAREFAQRELKDAAGALDREHRYPAEFVAKLAEMGLMGVAIPDEYGGAGMDYVSYVVAMEEISAACAGTGVIMSVNNSLVCDPLLKFGTEEQKKEILTPLAMGELLGCFGLTEPSAGSDASMIRTTAVRDGDSYVSWSTRTPPATPRGPSSGSSASAPPIRRPSSWRTAASRRRTVSATRAWASRWP